MKYDDFKRLKQLQSIGKTQKETSEKLSIGRRLVEKWWAVSEEEYFRMEKGKIEYLVGFVKYNFLEGRTYCGIDSLNSACLRWLDTQGNDVINDKKQFLATRNV